MRVLSGRRAPPARRRTAAVGYDNIDVTTARKLGIAYATPRRARCDTADLALSSSSRPPDLDLGEDDLRHGAGPDGALTPPRRDVNGPRSADRLRADSQAVAARAAGFDMEILHTSRNDTGLPASCRRWRNCWVAPTS